VQFSGRLHVDGKIEGSIRADDAAAVLTLSSHAQGGRRDPGAAHRHQRQLSTATSRPTNAWNWPSNARVEGNVFYNVLEMSAGAQINGKMVHRAEPPRQPLGPASEEAKS
jgi:cytoskeletal protein CcmA (bactofilin family)